MNIRATIAVFALGLAFLCAPREQQPSPKDHEQSGKQFQPPITPPVPAAINAPIGQPKSSPQQESTGGEPDDSLIMRLCDALIMNWPLVAIGVPGIWFALRTLKAIEGQTELQGIAFRQWLAIENWQDIPYEDTSGAKAIHIEFEVINPTKFPLTLKSISIKIGETGNTSVFKNSLPPDHHYTAIAFAKVTDEQMQKREEATLVLPIAIAIVYDDVLEKERDYSKNGMLALSKTGVSFHTFHGPGIYMKRKGK